MSLEVVKNKIFDEKESLNGISRRNFIKLLGIFTLSLALPESLQKGDTMGAKELEKTIKKTEEENLKNFIENMEKEIIKRESWDIKWPEIKKQYEKKIGEKFSLEINGEKREKTVQILSYEDIAKLENLPSGKLEDILTGIVVHHSGIEVNKKAKVELNATRNHHVEKKGFNDIAYHFLIDKDGKIYEGRPINRMGAHAGSTKETKEYIEKHLDNLDDLNPENEDYEDKLKNLIQANKMDPDFRKIGICVFGDFEGGKMPNYKQIESLKNLSNYLKIKYHIPKENIIGHSDVHDKIIKENGYSKISADKHDCPGFPVKLFNYELLEDTEKAKTKI